MRSHPLQQTNRNGERIFVYVPVRETSVQRLYMEIEPVCLFRPHQACSVSRTDFFGREGQDGASGSCENTGDGET